jgi:hypothetical protein
LDPFGACLPALWLHDLRDRAGGRTHRANARWALVSAPPGPGKLVWISAGATIDAVNLGVQIVRAIHAHRQDVRLVLTFEAEFPELLHPLRAAPRIGFGYAPADYAGSLLRVSRRLEPFGIVLAGTVLRPNFARLASAVPHCLAIATTPRAGAMPRIERAYPSREAEHWNGAENAPMTDLSVLWASAHVESTIGLRMAGAVQRRLWWWHGDDAVAGTRLAALWRGRFREDILLMSGTATADLSSTSDAVVRLSTWNGEPLPGSSIVLVDGEDALPEVAAAACAGHLATFDTARFWQALAAGIALTRGTATVLPRPALDPAIPVRDAVEDNLEFWAGMRQHVIARRAAADAARKAFWSERRTAEAVRDELLGRVFAWN